MHIHKRRYCDKCQRSKWFHCLLIFSYKQISILNEIHTPIYEDTQLSWYIGYGGHLGIWSEEWRKKNNTLDKSNISVGFDGIIGLDYKVKNSPLNVSIDWQPSFSIIQGYFKNQGGIGIRYTLK